MSGVLPKVDHCLNCGTAVSGNFCPECGQRADDRNVSLKVLLADMFVDGLNVDSRLFRTLGSLLVRPGYLTREYVAGRRTRYMSPFRMYLVMSVLFFLVLFWNINVGELRGPLGPVGPVPTPPPASMVVPPLMGGTPGEVPSALPELPEPAEPPLPPHRPEMSGHISVGPFTLNLSDLSRTVEEYDAAQRTATGAAKHSERQQRLTRQAIRLMHNPREFVLGLKENVPKMMFLLLPFFALLLKLLYIRTGRFYVEHLIFSLHGHAFVFLMLTLGLLVGVSSVTSLLLLASAVYLLVSMRRVYSQSWGKTLLKFGLLGGGYGLLLVISLAGTVLLTVLTS